MKFWTYDNPIYCWKYRRKSRCINCHAEKWKLFKRDNDVFYFYCERCQTLSAKILDFPFDEWEKNIKVKVQKLQKEKAKVKDIKKRLH